MTARYLALGDSYTIGEAVADSQRWPVQLAERLRALGAELAEPEIVATTGWTTDELAAGIDAAHPRGPYELVSLQIGVNDQYRGREVPEFREGLDLLLRRAVELAGGDAGRLLVLSIPDWSVTPYADGDVRGRHAISGQIDAFNRVVLAAAERVGARYIDVTPASRRAANDPALTAQDGLHPSGLMYAEWVELILPAARAALGILRERPSGPYSLGT